MIKKEIVKNHAFSTFITFSRINSFSTAFIISNLQEGFHQDILPFGFLKFSKHNFLNILEDNISFLIQVKHQ